MKKSALITLWALTSVSANAALDSYFPLNEGAGTTTANAVPTGPEGTLLNDPLWTVDPIRGSVVGFDGADDQITAGQIGPIAPETPFTMAFWSNTNPAQLVNNDVIVGNRLPDEGWMKFTPAAFEFRNLTATFNVNLDYPDMATGVWVHHALVKRGRLFIYYRNGIAQRNGWGPEFEGLPAGTPLYLGGDTTAGECWQGLLDDVAHWSDALPTSSVMGLVKGTYTPLTAPLTATGPTLVSVFNETFSGDLAQWTPTTLGLENNAAAGYDAPVIAGGTLKLGGTTTSQYWFGSSLETVRTFDSRQATEVKVDRVSLTGSGTAYRSSIWLLGDAGHYLHLSQNLGENGWQFNARDDGGDGTLSPTGGGNNLPALDGMDGDGGEHKFTLRVLPGNSNGRINVEILVDGELQAVHGFTSFPTNFRVVLTGQARAIGDFAEAVFDNVEVLQEPVTNLPPSFSTGVNVLASGREAVPYTASVASLASDPENAPLTFTKTGGSGWVTLAPDGTLSGTPGPGDTGVATLSLTVSDGVGSALGTVTFRVQPAVTAPRISTARWPLNDGAGALARETLGQFGNATIFNDATGGLGDAGLAWVNDATRGVVLSFNGDDVTAGNPGSYAVVGSPPADGTLPVFSLTDDFSLSCWVKSDQAANNDIILGNRYDVNGVDFAPRQFIKLTTSQFEWHWNGIGQNINIPDMVTGSWHHHLVVKEGSALFYYLDGLIAGMTTITGAPDQPLPIYFGGQGVENWRGSLSDVRFFSTALSDTDAAALFAEPTPPTPGFAITSIQVDSLRNVSLTWTVTPGMVYSVLASRNLNEWFEQVDGLTTGSYTVQPGGFPNTATEGRLHFRIQSSLPPP